LAQAEQEKGLGQVGLAEIEERSGISCCQTRVSHERAIKADDQRQVRPAGGYVPTPSTDPDTGSVRSRMSKGFGPDDTRGAGEVQRHRVVEARS